MAEKKTKRYFWLKMKDDFFNQKEIKMLRKIAGGDTYTVIYLKMLLLSLKNEGKLFFDKIAENFIEEIALEIDEDVENVRVTFAFLQAKGLIEFIQDDEIELTNIASMIGSETDKAWMMRRKRAQDKVVLGNNVTQGLPNGYTEIEIEKDIELDKDKDIHNISAKADVESDFEKLWSLYPKKERKSDALKAYKKAIKEGVTNKQIQDGIVAYKNHLKATGTDPRYIKQGGTWFNQQCWNDEYSVDIDYQPKQANGFQKQKKVEQLPYWKQQEHVSNHETNINGVEEAPTENDLKAKMNELFGGLKANG